MIVKIRDLKRKGYRHTNVLHEGICFSACIREGSRFSALRKEHFEKREVDVSTTSPTTQRYIKSTFCIEHVFHL